MIANWAASHGLITNDIIAEACFGDIIAIIPIISRLVQHWIRNTTKGIFGVFNLMNAAGSHMSDSKFFLWTPILNYSEEISFMNWNQEGNKGHFFLVDLVKRAKVMHQNNSKETLKIK